MDGPSWEQLLPEDQHDSDSNLFGKLIGVRELLQVRPNGTNPLHLQMSPPSCYMLAPPAFQTLNAYQYNMSGSHLPSQAQGAALDLYKQQEQEPGQQPDGAPSTTTGPQPQAPRSRSSGRRGHMGFTPLARHGPSPASTPRPAAAQQAQRGAPQGHSPRDDGAAPTFDAASFLTPAVAKLPAPGLRSAGPRLHAAAHATSSIPTHVPFGSDPTQQRCLAVSSPQPAQPRQWGALPLLPQADTAPSQAVQEEERAQPLHRAGAKPRGFQGNNQNRRPRGSTAQQTTRRAAATHDQRGSMRSYFAPLRTSSSAAAPDVAKPGSSGGEDCIDQTQSARKTATEAAAAAPALPLPSSPPDTERDAIVCPTTVRRGALQQPARNGMGQVPVWRSKHRDRQPGEQQQQQQESLGLSLAPMQHGASAVAPAQASVHAQDSPDMHASEAAASVEEAGSPDSQPAQHQHSSMQGLEQASSQAVEAPALFVPETCMSQAGAAAAAPDSIPDTPDTKRGRFAASQQSRALQASQKQQQEDAGEGQTEALHMQGSQAAAAEAATKEQQEGTGDRSLCFGRPVLAAVPSPCGALVAVCLADAGSGSTACSVQIWRMNQGGQRPAWAGTVRTLLCADQPEGLQLQNGLCLKASGYGDLRLLHCACNPCLRALSHSLWWHQQKQACMPGHAKSEHLHQEATLLLMLLQEQCCSAGTVWAAATSASAAAALRDPRALCSRPLRQPEAAEQRAAAADACPHLLCAHDRRRPSLCCGCVPMWSCIIRLNASSAVMQKATSYRKGSACLTVSCRLALGQQTCQHALCCELNGSACLLAGEGGRLLRWRMQGSDWQSPEALPDLPAAAFGGIEFPNIAELAAAGPNGVLGCSSAGSVALWDHVKCAAVHRD